MTLSLSVFKKSPFLLLGFQGQMRLIQHRPPGWGCGECALHSLCSLPNTPVLWVILPLTTQQRIVSGACILLLLAITAIFSLLRTCPGYCPKALVSLAIAADTQVFLGICYSAKTDAEVFKICFDLHGGHIFFGQ